MRQTKVRFIESEPGKLSILEVEAPPNHPIHNYLAEAVARLGLQIVQREMRFQAGHSVQRIHLAAPDGGAIEPQSRLQLQSLLISSADGRPGPLSEQLRSTR